MKNLVPVVLVVLLVGVLALVLFSKSPPRTPPEGARDAAKLVLISPHSEDIRREFETAFRTWHQAKYGEDVVLAWPDLGGTTADVRYIKSEFSQKPDGIGIDIFWGGGVEPYIELAEQNLLAPAVDVPEGLVSALPRRIAGLPVYDEEQRWFGTAISGFGVIYNKPLLASLQMPEPQTWAALGDPKAVDQVVGADPRESGSAFAAYEVMLQAYGWQEGWRLLHTMAGNIKGYKGAAGDVPKLVSLGEAAMGPAIDFYAWAQIKMDGEAKIGYVLPAGLTVVNPDAIAMLKGAPHARYAARFLEFVLSEDGQKLWILPAGTPGGPRRQNLGRIPVRPDLLVKYAAVRLPLPDPTQFRGGFHYDTEKAAARRTALKDLIGALLIDTHPEMKKAWAALIAAGLPAAAMAKFVEMPVTEEELTQLAREQWRDAVAQNEAIAAWTRFARDKYSAVIQMCRP